ncbi:MAG: hypothetical protein V1873_02155 [Verrucomicrobiota bacterium]
MRIPFLVLLVLALPAGAQELDRDRAGVLGGEAVRERYAEIAPGDLVVDGVRLPSDERGDTQTNTYINLHLKSSEREEAAGDILIRYSDSIQACLGPDGSVRHVTRRPKATARLKPGAESPAPATKKMISINFRDAPIVHLAQFYSELMGVEVSVGEECKHVTVTLFGEDRLTQEQVDVFIRAALRHQGIALEPAGENKLKLVCQASP